MIKPISFQISFAQPQNKSKTTTSIEASKPLQIRDLGSMPYYCSFKKRQDSNIEKAQAYLKQAKEELSLENEDISIYNFDLDKLEGIQDGIKVFDGMNIKEIAFILSNLFEVAVFRGCYNNCAHCYADGKPPIKETPFETAKMGWENFKLLTDGIKELDTRLGFRICNQPGNGTGYMTAFHDADCSQIYLKDKDGNTHDWAEIAKNLYEATGVKQIFDTSGWYLEDKKAQARVESYVQKALKHNDNEYYLDFNISMNPYHAQHFRAVEHMRQGNKEKEEFFRTKDTERMANTLFTFTPLLKRKSKLRFIERAMSSESKNSEGISEKDLKKDFSGYLKKLKELYEADFEGEQKVITNKKQIKDYLHKYKKLLKTIDTTPTVAKKLKELYEPNDPVVLANNKNIFDNPKIAIDESFASLIDANGDIYITNFYESYKVDLQLNFDNKNKSTQPIAPNLSQKPVSRELIEKFTDSIDDSKY